MKYIVTNGTTTLAFETNEAYKAILEFMKSTGSAVSDLTIRSFGGSNIPAIKLWPRLRKLS